MNKTRPEINKLILSDPTKSMSMESKFLLKPIGILIFVIILFIGSLKFGLGQINSVKSKIDESKKNEKLLINKIDVLKNVTTKFPENISFIDLALPSKGIAIYGMSQVKNQADLLGLIVTNLRTGNPVDEKNGISRVSISFDVQGDEQLIYEYLNKFPKLLPLMKVDKLSISNIDGISNASVTLSAFSGDFPEKIPSLQSPVKDLTDSESEVLYELSNYIGPEFMVTEASSDNFKEDPFN